MDAIRAFFSKIRALFLIFKGEAPPCPPSCAPSLRKKLHYKCLARSQKHFCMTIQNYESTGK